MSQSTSLASDAPEAIFDLGMKSGALLAIDLIRAHGPEAAAEVTHNDLLASLTAQEYAILADAYRRIRELRTAPASPAPLTGPLAPPAAACAVPSCRICPAIGGQSS